MQMGYTAERNAQILISLLKQHGISRIIASPGTTNICFVASLQQDPFFTVYSAPEERVAGYMACGMAAEDGRPVVLSCTGATASRNYMPALTEAYYRKLPVLAVTSSRRSCRIGHNFDQVTDRTVLPNDVAKLSVQVPLVFDLEGEWANTIAVNKAILELYHHGGGPVHINLETNYCRDYSVRELPIARCIRRVTSGAEHPAMPDVPKVIMVGSHIAWDSELTEVVDRFCEQNDAVVLCDHLSNYPGRYGIRASLMSYQSYFEPSWRNAELIIHIGCVTGSDFGLKPKMVWRVSPDGSICDTYRKLTYVFEEAEIDFFKTYIDGGCANKEPLFYNTCSTEEANLRRVLQTTLDSLPFSNAWMASQTAGLLPERSALHLGIQNSLRFWNLFDIPHGVTSFCNTGGFGIDGTMSAAIGAALSSCDKPVICVLGDLAFFYEMNALGNRHVSSNLRILLVNNGRGTEFRLDGNPGSMFGDDADTFIAAAGHYGSKSPELVKHFAADLGFEYVAACDKESYRIVMPKLISTELRARPLLVEAFTESSDENAALSLLRETLVDAGIQGRRMIAGKAASILGDKPIAAIKRMLDR